MLLGEDRAASYLFDVGEFESSPDVSDDAPRNCESGSIAEAEFLVRAQRNGWHCYIPFGHATTADVILFRPFGRPVTVQIKKGVYQDRGSGSWKIMAGAGKPSCAVNPKDYGKRYRVYQRGEFDVLAMWVQEKECLVFWTLNELIERGVSCVRWYTGNACNNWQVVDEMAERPI
jgi:hypothetical protein